MAAFLENLLVGDRDAILLVAAGYFALMGIIISARMISLSHWPSIIGELHEKGIQNTGTGAISVDEREYSTKVRYSYTVDGVTLENDQLNPWFVRVSHNLRALLKLQFRGIERLGGARVRVYYNRHNPQKSYLDVPGWKSIILVSAMMFGSTALILTAM